MTTQKDFKSKVTKAPERSLTHTGGVGLPGDRYPLPLAGSAVGDEGLAVAVFVDRTLAHVRHTRSIRTTREFDNASKHKMAVMATIRL